MKSAIESRVRVDARGVVMFQDVRLTPGEEVEIVVRPIQPSAETPSFLATAKRVRIDAPSDFSECFDEVQKLAR